MRSSQACSSCKDQDEPALLRDQHAGCSFVRSPYSSNLMQSLHFAIPPSPHHLVLLKSCPADCWAYGIDRHVVSIAHVVLRIWRRDRWTLICTALHHIILCKFMFPSIVYLESLHSAHGKAQNCRNVTVHAFFRRFFSPILTTLMCRSRRAFNVVARRAFVHLKVPQAGRMESSTSVKADVLLFDVPIHPLLAIVVTQWTGE